MAHRARGTTRSGTEVEGRSDPHPLPSVSYTGHLVGGPVHLGPLAARQVQTLGPFGVPPHVPSLGPSGLYLYPSPSRPSPGRARFLVSVCYESQVPPFAFLDLPFRPGPWTVHEVTTDTLPGVS